VFGADNAGIGSARTSSRRSPGLIPSHPEPRDHNRCRGEPPMHGVVSAVGDHAAGWRRGQAKTGLTARRGTVGRWAPLRSIGRSSSPSPKGDRPFGNPGLPPTGASSVSHDEPEPSGGPGDVSRSAKPPVSGDAVTKRPAPQWNRPNHWENTMTAARLPSQALPQSLEAAKRSIVPLSNAPTN